MQFIFVVQCLIYFGVLFVKYPGGILYNNSINGVASMVAGVALLVLFSSKYRFRRQILIFQYFVAGVLAIALAFLSKYHPERYLSFHYQFLRLQQYQFLLDLLVILNLILNLTLNLKLNLGLNLSLNLTSRLPNLIQT